MEDNGNISTHQLSPRVRDLFGTAMRLAARVKLSVELTESDAHELAHLRRIETALMRLRERLTIRRVLPGIESDQRMQVRLAVYELAAEANGGTTAQVEIIRRAVQAAQAKAAETRSAEEKARELLELLDKSKTSSPAQREFIRRVDRLRRRQLHQLRSVIFDQAALDHATCKLDEIYGRYVTAAMACA
jgi:hypothetical protein